MDRITGTYLFLSSPQRSPGKLQFFLFPPQLFRPQSLFQPPSHRPFPTEGGVSPSFFFSHDKSQQGRPFFFASPLPVLSLPVGPGLPALPQSRSKFFFFPFCLSFPLQLPPFFPFSNNQKKKSRFFCERNCLIAPPFWRGRVRLFPFSSLPPRILLWAGQRVCPSFFSFRGQW